MKTLIRPLELKYTPLKCWVEPRVPITQPPIRSYQTLTWNYQSIQSTWRFHPRDWRKFCRPPPRHLPNWLALRPDVFGKTWPDWSSRYDRGPVPPCRRCLAEPCPPWNQKALVIIVWIMMRLCNVIISCGPIKIAPLHCRFCCWNVKLCKLF